jgi:capsular polysaccharide biosynthesis protein
MDIKTFLLIMKRRIWMIAITAAILLGISAIATFYVIKPTYENQEFLLIGTFNDTAAVTDTQKVNRILSSSMDLINSSVVFDQVQQEINISKRDLTESIAIKNNPNSQIINITVRNEDPYLAKRIAQTFSNTAIEKVNQLLNVSEVEMLTKIDSNSEKIGSHTLNMAIGLTVGLLAGVGMAILRDYMDDTVRSPVEIEQVLGLAVIGEVSLNDKAYMKKQHKKKELLDIRLESGGNIHAQSNTGNG